MKYLLGKKTSKETTVHFGRICLKCRIIFMNPKFELTTFEITVDEAIFTVRTGFKNCSKCSLRIIRIIINTYNTEREQKTFLVARICLGCNHIYLKKHFKQCEMIISKRYGE